MKKSSTFLNFRIDTHWAVVIISCICLLIMFVSFEVGEQFGKIFATN